MPSAPEPEPGPLTYVPGNGPGGAVAGRVKDKTGKSLSGVTVVATSPALKGTQAELTDDKGRYLLTSLPRGRYVVAFYYAEIVLERSDVDVREGTLTSLNQAIDTTAEGGETIMIREKVGTIDVYRSRCAHLTTDCREDNPLPGRTFEDVELAPPPKAPPCR